MSFDKTSIIGNLGQDAELKYMPNGNAVCNFSVCVNRYKGPEKPKEAFWFKPTLWGKQAEGLAQYLKKGTQVYIEGEITPRLYEDKNGNPAISNDIRVHTIQLLGGKSDNSENSTGQNSSTEQHEDIPF